MKNLTKTILVFGGGFLQLSIINECKKLGLTTVVIDPSIEAPGAKVGDVFELVAGDDLSGTCEIIEKYDISAIITAATDKPLVMMSQVAAKYKLPFISGKTAIVSTDKLKMKEQFLAHDVRCAKGKTISGFQKGLDYPLILKPRDNSGSRGVICVENEEELEAALGQTFPFTTKESVLAEEVIEGQEFSVESIHFDNCTEIIQITEKLTTDFPYNVEIGHIQPARLSDGVQREIESLIDKVAESLEFKNCAAHTEIKINEKGIYVIESSPRLGGDFITSKLVPLSTGINIEKMLIKIAMGQQPIIPKKKNKASGVFYFNLPTGIVESIDDLDSIMEHPNVIEFNLGTSLNMEIPAIRNSLDRYGCFIVQSNNRDNLLDIYKMVLEEVTDKITIRPC